MNRATHASALSVAMMVKSDIIIHLLKFGAKVRITWDKSKCSERHRSKHGHETERVRSDTRLGAFVKIFIARLRAL